MITLCIIANNSANTVITFTDYISSPTDTTCDDSGDEDNDTSIEYSICTDTTIDAVDDDDAFAIRKSTVGDYHENQGMQSFFPHFFLKHQFVAAHSKRACF